MSADAWQEVRQELAIWQASGQTVRIWFRDDDAIRVTPALRQLESLARKHGLQIGLAVIPGPAQTELVDYLHAHDSSFHPMCHGWMHEIHQSIEFGEFGAGRPQQALRVDAIRALKQFQRLFGNRYPIFVPPFGRLDDTFIPELMRIGFAGVSNKPTLRQVRLARLHASFPRLPQGVAWLTPPPGLLDAHIDPIDWKQSTALSEPHIARQLVGELRLRRKRYIRTDAPIGILTHHLVHDDAVWARLSTLMDILASSPAVAFQAASDLAMECETAIHRRAAVPRSMKHTWRDVVPYD